MEFRLILKEKARACCPDWAGKNLVQGKICCWISEEHFCILNARGVPETEQGLFFSSLETPS